MPREQRLHLIFVTDIAKVFRQNPPWQTYVLKYVAQNLIYTTHLPMSNQTVLLLGE